MKLSKSKLALAKVINENGGWLIGGGFNFVTSSRSGAVKFFHQRPRRDGGNWTGGSRLLYWVDSDEQLPNWHKTILSREEYYQAYQKADEGGWIEWGGGECPVGDFDEVQVKYKVDDGSGMEGCEAQELHWHHEDADFDIVAYRLHKQDVKPEFCESVMRSIPELGSIDELCTKVTEENKHQHVDANPTIEQLAHDYRNAKDYAVRLQKEADDAARSADAKLRELERAGESIGLIIGIAKQESAPVIIDWRDLKVGDEIRCIGDWQDELTDGLVLKVDDVEMPDYRGDLAVRVLLDGGEGAWGKDFEFISRP